MKYSSHFITATILLSLALPALSLAADNFGDFEAVGGIVGQNSIQAFIDANRGQPTIAFINLVIRVVIGAVVTLGVISIVVGGYLYMTAGGDSSRVGQAKTWIGAALLGIALALAAFIVLNTISPQFASQTVDPVCRSIPALQAQLSNPNTTPQEKVDIQQRINDLVAAGCPRN